MSMFHYQYNLFLSPSESSIVELLPECLLLFVRKQWRCRLTPKIACLVIISFHLAQVLSACFLYCIPSPHSDLNDILRRCQESHHLQPDRGGGQGLRFAALHFRPRGGAHFRRGAQSGGSQSAASLPIRSGLSDTKYRVQDDSCVSDRVAHWPLLHIKHSVYLHKQKS